MKNLSDHIEDRSRDFIVRIDLSASHKIDYIGLIIRPIPSSIFKIRKTQLELASHVVYRGLIEQLNAVDGDSALLSISYNNRWFFDIHWQNLEFQRDLLFYACNQNYTINEE